ncbi:hypothetical protein L6452_19519 [Arctium lappa]|uniref:Uncharacterized protein n=1 Tax=Arctium lappa TaxID=4217 RepID=A0ACB9B8W8_ARCLA|nr:hypothetical protein L6452_19519 [Arctium lappa]
MMLAKKKEVGKALMVTYDESDEDISDELADKRPKLKVRWTKSSEDVEAQEDLKRKNTIKMQLPLCYDKLNDSYISDQPTFLFNDYFKRYSNEEMEAKHIEGKVYVPPLVLESKISQLRKILEKVRILVELEQTVFFTVLLNTDSKSEIKAEDKSEPHRVCENC